MFSFLKRASKKSPEASIERISKWYFAINEHGLLYAYDQVSAAVESAKKNTTLIPHCLVDARSMSDDALYFLAELEEMGVKIIRHTSSYYALLYTQFGQKMEVYSGHWLRCDIPEIEKEDDFILYTDIDVIFLKDPALIKLRPKIIACAPEHHQDDFSYFNSGVMIMNLPALRATSQKLRETVTRRLSTMEPHDDQGALNECYFDLWDRLPNIWNWKPYWGHNQDTGVLHFHGPKPGNIRDMLAGETAKFGDSFETIYNRNPEGYRQALQNFDEFHPPVLGSNSEALS